MCTPFHPVPARHAGLPGNVFRRGSVGPTRARDVGTRRRLWRWVLAGVAVNAALLASQPVPHRTQPPLTYMRDYAAGHLDDEKFLAAIAANAPELLVLGKDAPLHHNWGPVAGTGGENQAFGQGEHIRRLSPVQSASG